MEKSAVEQGIKKVLISERELKKTIERLGKEISRDYEGKNLLLVSVLKGSVVTLADIMRAITIPCEIDFMVVSSYGGSNVVSSGNIQIIKDLTKPIHDYDVLIIEDILDSGYTLSCLCDLLRHRNPRSLKICTLLEKPDRHRVTVNADYVGHTVPDEFVVGFGLDYDEKYRNLPYVGILKEEVYSSPESKKSDEANDNTENE